MIITIDGPAVSGKSTVAKMLARSLHFYYLNTGLLYRALAYGLLFDKQYDQQMLSNPKQEDILYCLDKKRLQYIYKYHASVFYEGKDITKRCKESDISQASSLVAADKFVRECMMHWQREMGGLKDLVIEGRDIGSNVFPQAELKFYLFASIGVRAQRLINFERYKGNDVSMEQAQQMVKDRDHRDMTRKHSPLLKPVGAIDVDASFISAAQVVDIMRQHVNALKKNEAMVG